MEKEILPTPAEIWKILREVSRGQKETRLQMQETDRRMKETDRRMQETALRMKETDLYIKETSREVRELKHTFSNRWGEFVESLVQGRLVKLLKGWDIDVTGTFPHAKGGFKYKDESGHTQLKTCEIDVIVRNGSELVAVEVKSTLDVAKVKHFMSVLKNFKKFFPEHKDKKIYGAVAYLKVYQEADIYAERQGLFVIKATGDSASLTNKKDFKPKDFSPP